MQPPHYVTSLEIEVRQRKTSTQSGLYKINYVSERGHKCIANRIALCVNTHKRAVPAFLPVSL